MTCMGGTATLHAQAARGFLARNWLASIALISLVALVVLVDPPAPRGRAAASAGAAASLLFRAFNDLLMALVGALAGLLVRRAAARNRE
jgi:hypothetical protein